MIVKNEQQHLARCLASVKPHVDELVVVDTGSSDRTVEIARQYGARVAFFSWCDDFAAARNFAIDQVSGDWILTLDADEELVVDWADWRSQVAPEAETMAYWLQLTDVNQPITPLSTMRLFRHTPALRYAGRYHESLRYQDSFVGSARTRELTGLQILHYGYEERLLDQKTLQRDIPMLERIRLSGEMTLLLLLTLSDAYLRSNQLEAAQSCLSEAFERLSPHLLTGEPPRDKTRLSAILFAIGDDLLQHQQDFETALLVCRRGLEWFPTYPPLVHLAGRLLQELGFPLGATAYFEQCLQLGRDGTYQQHEPFDRAFMTLWPAYDLGLLYLHLKDDARAAEAFKLALSFDPNYAPAQEGLALIQGATG
ncbi:hypothetical protein BST81_25820 [Leptolyngbya sp. 'hensonii']|nr:hypothetical protein BST81_25820 [Leptolyngbya sp. 'hensonii']